MKDFFLLMSGGLFLSRRSCLRKFYTRLGDLRKRYCPIKAMYKAKYRRNIWFFNQFLLYITCGSSNTEAASRTSVASTLAKYKTDTQYVSTANNTDDNDNYCTIPCNTHNHSTAYCYHESVSSPFSSGAATILLSRTYCIQAEIDVCKWNLSSSVVSESKGITFFG